MISLIWFVLYSLMIMSILLVSCFLLFFGLIWLLMIGTLSNGNIELPNGPVRNVGMEKNMFLSRYPKRVGTRVYFRKIIQHSSTTVHVVKLQFQEKTFSFLTKREDGTHKEYGGNKVRALEFLLPYARKKTMLIPSTPGSNLCVASLKHRTTNENVVPLLMFPEAISRDNGKNARFTCTNCDRCEIGIYERFFVSLPRAIRALVTGSEYVVAPGGANVQGALGYISIPLEMEAEGIFPKHIWLTVGSGATLVGMVIGIALVRRKRTSWRPCIHGVCVNGIVCMYCPWIYRYYLRTMTIRIARLLKMWGLPDLEDDLVNVLLPTCVSLDMSQAGRDHGAFNSRTLSVRTTFRRAHVDDRRQHRSEQRSISPPEICSTYTSKTASAMLAFLACHPEMTTEDTLFLSTKCTLSSTDDNDAEQSYNAVKTKMRRKQPKLCQWIDKCFLSPS